MWRTEDVIEKLREDQGELSLRAYAEVVGCKAGYLNDVYHNRREPSTKLLDRLGIERTKTISYTYAPRKWRK